MSFIQSNSSDGQKSLPQFFPVRRLSCREPNNWRYRSFCNGIEIFQSMWHRELPFINWAAFGAAQFIKWVPFFFSQGYFWQVVEGVHRPALLNFTLFQSNIYKVNVREYPPRIYVVKTDNFELYDGLTWSTTSHVKRRRPLNKDVFVFFFIVSFKRLYDEYVLGFFFTICWSLNIWMMFSLLKRDCKSLCVCG